MTRKARVTALALACAVAAPAADTAMVQGLNHFSDALYAQAAKRPGNLVLSPYSISAALSMALAGARGDTAAEMRRVLGQQESGPAYHVALGELIANLQKAANVKGNEFMAANSLWTQKQFPILREFTSLLDRSYHASPTPVDFERDPEAARAAINAWTDRATRGKIQNLFAPGTIQPDTRVVLASAVYFNGKWEHAFRRGDTQPGEFHLPSGATEQVPFMHRTGDFGYAETAGGQTLEIRYNGTGLAFDILLPKEGTKLDTVEAAISGGKLSGWLGGIQERKVRASIPRFRVAYEASLRPALEAIGMRRAFRDGADFSGVDDKRDLCLSQVVHKAWVDVNEEGTEAAAATGATMALVSMVTPSEPEFRADRPFVFLIRDTRSGLILFAGRLMDPK